MSSLPKSQISQIPKKLRLRDFPGGHASQNALSGVLDALEVIDAGRTPKPHSATEKAFPPTACAGHKQNLPSYYGIQLQVNISVSRLRSWRASTLSLLAIILLTGHLCAQDAMGRQKQDSNTQQQSEPSAASGSPGHIFWVVPAFKVQYGKDFKPLTTKEKFDEWAQTAYDPLGLGVSAFEAGTLEHSSKDGFCGYGRGWPGYGKCFGALELDSDVSSFIGDFALTSLLHQDPRYFRLGKGSFAKRVSYAVSRVFVTYNDSGHTVFYSSALAGTAAAAAISNLYYPEQDRGLGHSVSRIGIDFANTALYNAAAEFWPDIHRGLRRLF